MTAIVVDADELLDRAGGRADNRQPTRERLGHGHAVALVQRRQDEHIGAIVLDRQPSGVQVADELDAIVDPIGLQLSAETLDGRRIALGAARTDQPPVAVRDRRERTKQQIVSLARDQCRHAQQRHFTWLMADG